MQTTAHFRSTINFLSIFIVKLIVMKVLQLWNKYFTRSEMCGKYMQMTKNVADALF